MDRSMMTVIIDGQRTERAIARRNFEMGRAVDYPVLLEGEVVEFVFAGPPHIVRRWR